MGKSGNPPPERERKVKRLDTEIIEEICSSCGGRGQIKGSVRIDKVKEAPVYTYYTCPCCEGLGVVYAEE